MENRTGEYTTGYVHGSASDSDKSAGVVALTMVDLRRCVRARVLVRLFLGRRTSHAILISTPFIPASTELNQSTGNWTSRGKVGRLGLCGVNGKKFPGIRAHMAKAIAGQYKGLDMTMDTFPSDEEVDPQAYDKAIEHFQPGDAVTIFTPGAMRFCGAGRLNE